MADVNFKLGVSDICSHSYVCGFDWMIRSILILLRELTCVHKLPAEIAKSSCIIRHFACCFWWLLYVIDVSKYSNWIRFRLLWMRIGDIVHLFTICSSSAHKIGLIMCLGGKKCTSEGKNESAETWLAHRSARQWSWVNRSSSSGAVMVVGF